MFLNLFCKVECQELWERMNKVRIAEVSMEKDGFFGVFEV